MNMIEALKFISQQENVEKVAARPVSWVNTGVAIVRINTMFVFASKVGLALAPLPGDECWADWETVTIDALEKEQEVIEAGNKAVLDKEASEVKVSDK